MTIIRAAAAVAVTLLMFTSSLATLACAQAPAPAPGVAQPPVGAPPEQQNVFVPIDQLPPQDQLAAGPLLVGAYVFVPLVLFFYLLSLAKRLSAVQRELERLELDLKRSGGRG
jgi:CcmD family protein